MVKEMLSVLMDGIKDTNMLMDYCESSTVPEQKTWFMNHAKQRMEQVLNDYNFVKSQIGLEQKINEGDAIAGALASHLEHEILELKNKSN